MQDEVIDTAYNIEVRCLFDIFKCRLPYTSSIGHRFATDDLFAAQMSTRGSVFVPNSISDIIDSMMLDPTTIVKPLIAFGDIRDEITIEQMPKVMTDALKRAGWNTLMPVQARAIPYFRAGQDLMVQAQTGSGKTGAFVLPTLIADLPPESRLHREEIFGPVVTLQRFSSEE